MTWEQIKNLTPSNGAIQDLKELLIMTNFTDEDLERFFTFRANVTKGDKLGWTGEMSDIGWAGSGCGPTYKKATIAAAEKEWDMGSWSIPLEWCYEELEGTIAEYCLKTGTDIGDLTSTEYMDYIVLPAMDLAIKHMMWRFIWFGDKNAANTTSSGDITDGVNVELFKTCDGLFKQLFTIVAANTEQRVTIAANAETTAALQRSKIRDAGVAIGIFDSLFDNADPRIAAMDGAGVFCTKSLADALTKDLKREYKLILEWEQIFKGLDVTEYDGHMIYRISIWDRFIQKYQNNGTKLNLPHRAVFGSPKQLFVGSPAKQIISDMDIWFDKKDRKNYMYSTGKLSTLVGEDNLFQLAY
ncbi:hypothetical protein [Bacteroides nordii]|jgi:hypothetical protein|uniref:hypothetical protein n=1 Tax=Bacteroides nordii TaxID=291645 RepID=UPI001F449A5C|nr:hypothetical protein [Bacteroides nordii]MCE8465883.1 hypothetical protein [Bacteroides nordii]UYU49793.1 hypothetical protein KQP55_04060 [Bacteroides nordii]DAZ20151.1 MAG TPA: major capsid protein [Caudoviricetes sp.]